MKFEPRPRRRACDFGNTVLINHALFHRCLVSLSLSLSSSGPRLQTKRQCRSLRRSGSGAWCLRCRYSNGTVTLPPVAHTRRHRLIGHRLHSRWRRVIHHLFQYCGIGRSVSTRETYRCSLLTDLRLRSIHPNQIEAINNDLENDRMVR